MLDTTYAYSCTRGNALQPHSRVSATPKMLMYCPALRNNGKLITAACCVWKVSNETPDNTSRATIRFLATRDTIW